jgi:uncharacterized membrane protein YoaK (UPF0700 family)
MALAMGGLNAVVHKAGRTQAAAAYVTRTLVHFGERLSDALCSTGRAGACFPYLLLWIALVCGGALGAIAYAAVGDPRAPVPDGRRPDSGGDDEREGVAPALAVLQPLDGA